MSKTVTREAEDILHGEMELDLATIVAILIDRLGGQVTLTTEDFNTDWILGFDLEASGPNAEVMYSRRKED